MSLHAGERERSEIAGTNRSHQLLFHYRNSAGAFENQQLCVRSAVRLVGNLKRQSGPRRPVALSGLGGLSNGNALADADCVGCCSRQIDATPLDERAAAIDPHPH
jgi:hypothetical protein